VESLQGAVDEPTTLVIEPQAQQHIGMLDLAEPRTLQQQLMGRNRLADLSFLAVQVAKDHVDLERIGVHAGGARQFLDREVDLVRDEKIETKNVVRRL